MSDSYSLSVALQLINRGVLTARAGRLMTYLQQHHIFCEPLQTTDGEIGIVWRERWYTPVEFNAMADGAYAPTADDIVASIRAMAAVPAPEPEAAPQATAPAAEPVEEEEEEPARPAPGTPEAEALLEEIHQASATRPIGTGAVVWGVFLLMVAGAAFATWALWQFAQAFGGR